MSGDVRRGRDLPAAEGEERDAADDEDGDDLQRMEAEGKRRGRILVTPQGYESETRSQLEVAEVRRRRRNGQSEVHPEEDRHCRRNAVGKMEGGERRRRGGDFQRPCGDG